MAFPLFLSFAGLMVMGSLLGTGPKLRGFPSRARPSAHRSLVISEQTIPRPDM